MTSPPEWPFLVRYDDGYTLYTEDDLARHPQAGPLRHLPRMAQYHPNLRIQAVYAEGFLQVDGMERFPGEVFFLHSTLEEWDLRQAGAITTLPPTDHPRTHRPSGRTFRDEPSYFSFVRRYERQDLSGIVWTLPSSSDDTAPLAATPAERLPTDAKLLRDLKASARRVRAARQPLTIANLAHYHDPRRHRNTISQLLKKVGLKPTDL